jgi:DnaD/phage-associated family protein
MANYRQLHTRTWSDSWFMSLSSEQKLLFIYLFSNQRASVTGLYELPIKIISLETGLDRSVILRAFEVYTATDKVYYDTKAEVVWVVNMPKYQLGERINSTLQKRIETDIKSAPDCKLKQRFFKQGRWWQQMGHACPIDGVNSISTQSQSQSQSLEGERVQGEGKHGPAPPGPAEIASAGVESPGLPPGITPAGAESPGLPAGIASAGLLSPGPPAGNRTDVFQVYQQNIGVLTPMIAEALRDAEKSDGAEWVCAAIEETVKSNARSWKYCEAILMRWRRDGFHSGTRPVEAGGRGRPGGGISNNQAQAWMEAEEKGQGQ